MVVSTCPSFSPLSPNIWKYQINIAYIIITHLGQNNYPQAIGQVFDLIDYKLRLSFVVYILTLKAVSQKTQLDR